MRTPTDKDFLGIFEPEPPMLAAQSDLWIWLAGVAVLLTLITLWLAFTRAGKVLRLGWSVRWRALDGRVALHRLANLVGDKDAALAHRIDLQRFARDEPARTDVLNLIRSAARA